MDKLNKKGVNLNRKMLSEIAIADMDSFSALVKDVCA
jgi:ribosomal protein L20